VVPRRGLDRPGRPHRLQQRDLSRPDAIAAREVEPHA
jgi:hypothetical protein